MAYAGATSPASGAEYVVSGFGGGGGGGALNPAGNVPRLGPDAAGLGAGLDSGFGAGGGGGAFVVTSGL